MTQRDLARALNVEASLIAKIELGERRVDVIEYVWILRALGAQPHERFAEFIAGLDQ